MTAPQTITEKLDRLPPFAVYAVSRCGRSRRLPLLELIRRSGLSPRTFARIAVQFTWGNIKLADMEAFHRGCGVNPMRQKQHLQMIKQAVRGGYKHPMSHLPRSMYRRFCRQCVQWAGIKAAKAISTVSA